MEEIRRVAEECIGRAVMFASLAIVCVMAGFSFNPVSALRSGALLALVLALILMWKAMTARTKNPKHTEVWLYLDKNTRPVDDPARRVFAGVMCEVYTQYAWAAFFVAIGFFLLSIILLLFGLGGSMLTTAPLEQVGLPAIA